MSVIWRVISSIHPHFPAYRFFARDFGDQSSKEVLYEDLARKAIAYLEFLLVRGYHMHLVLERQTGTKVTAEERSRARAKAINHGLDLIHVCTSEGHANQGKELINKSISFSHFDQREITKRILQLKPGLSFTNAFLGWSAYVCVGEADSGILDVIESIKTLDSCAIAVACSSDSDFLFMSEIGRNEESPDLVDFLVVPQFK
jgi:hypothetical protein